MSGAEILSHTDEEIRANVETNFLGPLFVARAFAPVLSAHDMSVLIDIHSALSWYAVAGIYSATKAALWSATNSLRLELAPAGAQVVGVHVGHVDTAMAAHANDPKTAPEDLVKIVFDAVEAGKHEVLADALSVRLKAGLSAPVEALYPQLASAPTKRHSGTSGQPPADRPAWVKTRLVTRMFMFDTESEIANANVRSAGSWGFPRNGGPGTGVGPGAEVPAGG